MKNSNRMQSDLMRAIRSSSQDIIVPNYYVGKYEMDVLMLDGEGGCLTESEVKLTYSDFLLDFKKGGGDKHDSIKNGLRCNRFYFVCHDDVIPRNKIPSYAGLVYFNNVEGFRTVVASPIITKTRFDTPAFYKAMAIRLALRDLNSKHKDWKALYQLKEIGYSLLPTGELKRITKNQK